MYRDYRLSCNGWCRFWGLLYETDTCGAGSGGTATSVGGKDELGGWELVEPLIPNESGCKSSNSGSGGTNAGTSTGTSGVTVVATVAG